MLVKTAAFASAALTPVALAHHTKELSAVARIVVLKPFIIPEKRHSAGFPAKSCA